MISIPQDVTDWLTDVFRKCNHEASSKLTLVPNSHEPWIDFAIIENLQRASSLHKFDSEWLVNIDTHWLGSAPLWPEAMPRWEIADIGFLVIFRSGNKLIRSKVALLQCKRLYAERQRPESEDDLRRYYWRGFGRMFSTDEQFAEMTHPKLFQFNNDSRYEALRKDDEQWAAIEEYERHKNVPVYYMLYNPMSVPLDVPVPRPSTLGLPPSVDVGCRIIPSVFVRQAMATSAPGSSPSYGGLAAALPKDFQSKPFVCGWPLEHFVVDLLLQCKAGRIMDIRGDSGLYNVFYRRTAPIQAAIAITIDAPPGFDWAVEPDQV